MATDLSALDNPNVRKALNIIANTEGTDKTGSGGGYDIAFGGGKLASLDAHPRRYYEFTQTDGKKNQTSAAGRYQFLAKTWDDVAKQLGLKDFSPRNQDIAAIELIRRAGALGQLEGGDVSGALAKLGGVWASLPSSPYAQPKVSQGTLDRLAGASPTDPRANYALAPEAKRSEFLMRNLEDEINKAGGLDQYAAMATTQPDPYSAMAASAPLSPVPTAAALDPYAAMNVVSEQRIANFDSSLFGPTPRDNLVSEANKIWDFTDTKPRTA